MNIRCVLDYHDMWFAHLDVILVKLSLIFKKSDNISSDKHLIIATLDGINNLRIQLNLPIISYDMIYKYLDIIDK